MFDESFLYRMEHPPLPQLAPVISVVSRLIQISEAFNCDDLRTVSARRRDETSHHGFAIQEDRTCTAFTFGAAFLGADQVCFLAQQAQESFVVSTMKCIGFPVDGCFNGGRGSVR